MKSSWRPMAWHLRNQRRQVAGTSDQGAALVLVLVLLVILALALGAMFAEAGANLHTSTVVAGQNKKVYAADAGVEIAIQDLRGSPLLCSGSTPTTIDTKTTIDGLQTAVTCQPASGAPGQVTIHSIALPPAGDPGTGITSTAVVSIAADNTVNIVSWVTVVQ
jgi:hypothetical protein